MKFPTRRPNQQKKWKHADNLWPVFAHILKLLHILMPVKWFFPRSQTLPTWCYLMPGLMCHTLHSHWHFYIWASNHQVKWSCSCTSQNHMWFSGFGLWSWDGRHIFGCPGSSPCAQHFGGIGALSTRSCKPHQDWQLHCPWHPHSPSSHEVL